MSDAELLEVRGVGEASVGRLRRRVRLLARLDGVRPPSERTVPGVPSAVLAALLDARSVRQEIEALAEGLPPRNASLFLARLETRGKGRPHLEDLGAEWGISRERVRQVVESRSRLLSRSGLHLPLATRAAELLDWAGGLASTPDLVELARADGVRLDSRILHSVRHVHELGLAPLIAYVPEVDSWVTEGGRRKWVDSGVLTEHLERVWGAAQASLRRLGCVQGCRLADGCLLTRWQRTRALASRLGHMEEVEGYLLPVPTVSSKLTRSVEKMLAVAPELSVRDVAEGLTRLRRDFPVIPPDSVIERLLAAHPAFQVRGGRVRRSNESPAEDPLSSAERVFVGILESEGGLVAYRTVLERMEAEGFSKHTAAVLMARSPFLRRADVGIYAAMGRSVTRPRFPDQRMNRRGSAARNGTG